jgi:hypothetical protein
LPLTFRGLLTDSLRLTMGWLAASRCYRQWCFLAIYYSIFLFLFDRESKISKTISQMIYSVTIWDPNIRKKESFSVNSIKYGMAVAGRKIKRKIPKPVEV